MPCFKHFHSIRVGPRSPHAVTTHSSWVPGRTSGGPSGSTVFGSSGVVGGLEHGLVGGPVGGASTGGGVGVGAKLVEALDVGGLGFGESTSDIVSVRVPGEVLRCSSAFLSCCWSIFLNLCS